MPDLASQKRGSAGKFADLIDLGADPDDMPIDDRSLGAHHFGVEIVDFSIAGPASWAV